MRQQLVQLHQILTDRFDIEELRILCLYLDVKYDHLHGEGQPGKAMALLEHLDNRGRIPALVDAGRKMRPDIDWPEEEVGEAAIPVVTSPPLRPIISRQSFEPEMILIPAGEFLMGSDPTKDKMAFNDEQPQHTLYLPDYYLAKSPVTNAQYLTFVQATGHDWPEHWQGDRFPRGKENHPVVKVSWYDARAYCNWLAEITGKPYRLPTEAEWEKGARGTDGRIWPWGDQEPTPGGELCNLGKIIRMGDTTPVGQYSPAGDSPYGCFDAVGNVKEWTASLYQDYPYQASDGRENQTVDDHRVIRGGSFDHPVMYVRCAVRGGGAPGYVHINVGFRVATAPDTPLGS